MKMSKEEATVGLILCLFNAPLCVIELYHGLPVIGYLTLFLIIDILIIVGYNRGVKMRGWFGKVFDFLGHNLSKVRRDDITEDDYL